MEQYFLEVAVLDTDQSTVVLLIFFFLHENHPGCLTLSIFNVLVHKVVQI